MASVTATESIATPAPLGNHEALYEVVNGQRVELPPMSAYAGWIASRLQSRMDRVAESKALGTVVTEVLFILDAERDLRRRPDVAFVSAQRWPLEQALPETGDWNVVPDLAVEVVSPNDTLEDVMGKVQEYFQFGVRQIWVVLPLEQQVYVYESPTQVRVLTAAQELDGGSLLPEFRLPVATLFKRQSAETSGRRAK